MAELKPCPKCGSKLLFEDSTFYYPLYGYAISCLNINCEQETVIRYGLTLGNARSRAIRAWNRRANND